MSQQADKTKEITFEHWKEDRIPSRQMDDKHPLDLQGGLTNLKRKGERSDIDEPRIPDKDFEKIREYQIWTFETVRGLNRESEKKRIRRDLSQKKEEEEKRLFLEGELDKNKEMLHANGRRRHVLADIKQDRFNTEAIKGHHYEKVRELSESESEYRFYLLADLGDEDNEHAIVAHLWDLTQWLEEKIARFDAPLENPMKSDLPSERIDSLFEHLKKIGAIDPHTDPDNFRRVFSGEDFRERITWTLKRGKRHNLKPLRDILELAHGEAKGHPYKRWAKECFHLSNGNEPDLPNKDGSAKDGDLEKAITGEPLAE